MIRRQHESRCVPTGNKLQATCRLPTGYMPQTRSCGFRGHVPLTEMRRVHVPASTRPTLRPCWLLVVARKGATLRPISTQQRNDRFRQPRPQRGATSTRDIAIPALHRSRFLVVARKGTTLRPISVSRRRPQGDDATTDLGSSSSPARGRRYIGFGPRHFHGLHTTGHVPAWATEQPSYLGQDACHLA